MQSTNNRPSITYELFSKIVGKSCLIDVLRNTIFGCQPEVPNVFIIDEKISFEDEYTFIWHPSFTRQELHEPIQIVEPKSVQILDLVFKWWVEAADSN